MSEEPQKIVALVDGSAYSASVCDHAAWLSGRTGAPVELIHVLCRREAPAKAGPVRRHHAWRPHRLAGGTRQGSWPRPRFCRGSRKPRLASRWMRRSSAC